MNVNYRNKKKPNKKQKSTKILKKQKISRLPFRCFLLAGRLAAFLLSDVLPLVPAFLVFAFLFSFLFLPRSIFIGIVAVLQ